MILEIISLILVGSGVACLGFSLAPALRIGKYYDNPKQSLGWKILSGLILCFVPGYLAFGSLILHNGASLPELIVSLILFGGGVFVIMVIWLSRASIDYMKAVAEKERHRALHDELTNLPNRALLHERIDHAILAAERGNRPVALLMLDLDRFKEINDTLGHFYGDYLLQLVAPRLCKAVRRADTVSRLGGDEFAVVLPGVECATAIAISEKIVRAMEQPFMIEGHELKLDISIGVALYPKHGVESEILLQRADVAMYAAKRSDFSYAVYDENHDKNSLEQLMLTSELREAVKKDQLVLHYQPKVCVADGKICGAEALVRWQRRDMDQLLNPGEFITLAEKTGMIEEITAWVLENAFAQLARWKAVGVDLPLSVNLSFRNLRDSNFPQQFEKLLNQWRITPDMITLEITESSMMHDPDRVFAIISRLHQLGVHLSIDNFGTGYSSLAYLKQISAAELKIDKSFVRNMATDENNLAIVRSTIGLANNMGLNVVAEGVETQKACDTLSLLGCATAQGYFFCPPLPSEQFIEKLNMPAQ